MKRLLILCLVSIHARSAGAQAADLAFGAILDHAFDRASQLLTQAESTGNFLEAQAAGRAQLLIESARRAYADSLELTASRMSVQQQQLVSGIRSLLDEATRGALDSLDKVAQSAQAVANIVPLSDHFPQAMQVSGTLIDPVTPSPAIEVSGNFFDAARDRYAPVLRIGTRELPATSATTRRLVFALPHGLVPVHPDALGHASATLEVPYQERCHLVAHCKRTSKFAIRVDVLPARAGKITLQQTKLTNVVEERDITSHEFIQDSSQDDKEETHCDSPGNGWTVEPGTVWYHLTHEEGRKDHDWFDSGNHSSASDACWRFKTLHKGFAGTSGKLHLTLTYHVHRTIPQPRPLPDQEVALAWNERRVLTADPGATWKLVYQRFDGKRIEIAAATTTPYLRVETAGSTITLVTPP